MRRSFLILAAVGTWCFWRRRHGHVKRQPLGGYRCADCRRAFADLAEADQMDGDAYVGPLSVGWRGNGIERSAR